MTVYCHATCPWCGKQVECNRREIGTKEDEKNQIPHHTTHTHSLTMNGKSSHYRTVGKAPELFRVKMVFGFHEWAKVEDGLKYDPNPKKEIF